MRLDPAFIRVGLVVTVRGRRTATIVEIPENGGVVIVEFMDTKERKRVICRDLHYAFTIGGG